MDYDEIKDEIAQEADATEDTFNFDLRDAVIYSTVLEKKY